MIGRAVFYAGKWLNNNGWGTDARMPKGVDQPFIVLDDSDLGGAHANHFGSFYLGGSTGVPGRGPMTYLINEDGTLETHNGGSDPYTNVGYTDAAFNGRVGATDYVTDLLPRKLRQWVAGAFGTKFTEPFFAVMSHRASHAAWLPATRHAASTIYVTGGSGTAVATDGSTDPPGFNAQPLGAWDQADKPALTSGQIAQVRADRIQKGRCGLSFDEAVYDVWKLCSTLNRPTAHIVTSDNGFCLGQNRDTAGKVSPYNPSAVAPLFVLWPGVAGRRIEANALVTPVDLTSLILAIAERGYNIVLHIFDDADRLSMESLPWLNGLAGTQAGETFTLVKFLHFVFSCSLCSPTRGDIHTGQTVRRHGITRHGNAPQDGTVDPGAATRFVEPGTPGYWFDNWLKVNQLTQWMRAGTRSSVAGDGMGQELLRIIDGTWATGSALRTHARFEFYASNEFVQPGFDGIQTTTRRVWRVSEYTDLTKGSTVFPAEVIATDLSTDPGETTNVALTAPWVPEMLARLDGMV